MPRNLWNVTLVDQRIKPASDADESGIYDVYVQADSADDARKKAISGPWEGGDSPGTEFGAPDERPPLDSKNWRATSVNGPMDAEDAQT